MLSPAEKAYCQALLALKRKEYQEALAEFVKAADAFKASTEFNLLWETTRLLVAVKEELADTEKVDRLQIEEAYSRG